MRTVSWCRCGPRDGACAARAEEVVRLVGWSAPTMAAVRGGEAVSVALLFSLAFFCARLLLDRLVYKV